MLNTLMLLVGRFRPKAEIEHKATAQGSCEETREQCEAIVARSQQLTEINHSDPIEQRKRVESELHTSDVSARQRDRQHMDKWFNRGELTNSGSYNIAELQRRMDEPAHDRDDTYIAALPATEDILMAFSKPEFDLFEEEKISLSGTFLKITPNEDFDEQYSMPLLPMHTPEESAEHVRMLNEYRSIREEFNLDFSVSDDVDDLPDLDALRAEISNQKSSLEVTLVDIPVPIPAFIPVKQSMAVEERIVSKIDPSVLFEEWTNDQNFDPTISELETLSSIPEGETVSSELKATEMVSFEPVPSTEVSSKRTAPNNSTPRVKIVSKANETYWSESDRLTRFGRRRTSASCSSTRLRALTQIA